ncbi:MAG: glycosyltransferase family A protein [Bacilli bacterium]|nr:glycosyltransferase family A protein [Bacilli bacterium]
MKVSVIVNIFNNPKIYLERCIRSIENQTYKNIEIILMDNYSTDSTRVYCKKYEEANKNIISIISSNINDAIEVSTGDFITFIDANDYLSFDAIDELLENEDNNIHVYIASEEINKSILDISDKKLIDINELSSKLYRKSFLKDNNITYNNNKDFNKKVISAAKNIMSINKKIYYKNEVNIDFYKLSDNKVIRTFQSLYH